MRAPMVLEFLLNTSSSDSLSQLLLTVRLPFLDAFLAVVGHLMQKPVNALRRQILLHLSLESTVGLVYVIPVRLKSVTPYYASTRWSVGYVHALTVPLSLSHHECSMAGKVRR